MRTRRISIKRSASTASRRGSTSIGRCSVRPAPAGTAGLVADGALSPWSYIDGLGVALGVPAFNYLNGASLQLGDYESFKKAALDPYVALRSAYYENRAEAVEKSRGKE